MSRYREHVSADPNNPDPILNERGKTLQKNYDVFLKEVSNFVNRLRNKTDKRRGQVLVNNWTPTEKKPSVARPARRPEEFIQKTADLEDGPVYRNTDKYGYGYTHFKFTYTPSSKVVAFVPSWDYKGFVKFKSEVDGKDDIPREYNIELVKGEQKATSGHVPRQEPVQDPIIVDDDGDQNMMMMDTSGGYDEDDEEEEGEDEDLDFDDSDEGF